MKTIYTELPVDEINEDEQIYTIGDDILNQFYYGNYSDAIKMMVKDNIEPNELAEYLAEQAIELDCNTSELYYGHFTLEFFASIGMSYIQARMKGSK